MPKKNAVPTFNYPPALHERGGNKVGWKYYATREEADKAAKVAQEEGEYKAAQGYDFGYCAPGSVHEVNGEFEVCVP